MLHLSSTPLPDAEYIGLFHASYPDKFSKLPPLSDIPVPPDPYTVYGAVVGRRYLDQARDVHPGMESILAACFAKTGLPLTQDNGPFCNSFIAHRDRWTEFLPAWKRCYDVLRDAPLTFDQSRCKPGLARAYLLERITTAWFAAYTDVHAFPGFNLYHPVYL